MSGNGIEQNAASSGRFRSAAATHRGVVRTHNEDAYVNRPDLGLWAVADGAGGHQSGDFASAEVVDALQAIPAGLSAGQVLMEVRNRLDVTHASLRQIGAQRGPGVMLATTVVVVIARGGHFACLWAGDSRSYLLHAGMLVQVSRDHSLVQDLLERGAITAEEAERHPHGNVITRAVGADCDPLELEKRTGRLMPGDRLLLCSDGLCKTLPEAQMAELLAGSDGEGAERLVMAALGAKANDNVTALTIELVGTDG